MRRLSEIHEGLPVDAFPPVELEQAVAVPREAEEDVLLFLQLERRTVGGTLALHEVFLGVERLTGCAIPALVRGGIQVARRVDESDDLLDAHAVPRLGRADEIVVRDPELSPEVPERRRVAVGDDDRGDAFLLRDLLDVLAVLVGAGQETHVLAREAEIAGERVRDDRGVEMPDVGPVIDVVDRGREVAARHEESRIPRLAILSETSCAPSRIEFYGERQGMVADPFGHHWHLSQQKEFVSPEEMQQRWSAVFEEGAGGKSK